MDSTYLEDHNYLLFQVQSFWDHLLTTEEVPTWCISIHRGKILIVINDFKTYTSGRKKVIRLQFNDSEGSGNINVMNRCHLGKQNDTFCQIWKFKTWAMFRTTTWLTWTETYILGPTYNKIKRIKPGIWAHFLSHQFEVRVKGISELEANLLYRVAFRTARATYTGKRVQISPVLNNNCFYCIFYMIYR